MKQENHSQELLLGYLENLKRLNKSEYTIKNYRADLEKFLKWFHAKYDTKLSKINGEIIGEYKNFLGLGGQVDKLTREYSPFTLWFRFLLQTSFFKRKSISHPLFFQTPMSVSSQRRHLSSLKNFFEYLKETHEDHSKDFNKNPVKNKIHAITLKEIDVTPTTMISREQFKLIEEKTFRTNERLMLYLLYYAGMRLSELTELKKSDFDFPTKTITFKRKGGYVHTLAPQKSELIFKNLIFFLDSIKEFNEGDYLFSKKGQLPLTSKAIYNKIVKIIERAIPTNAYQEKISPHSFRKACATELYLKSKDLLFVRDYLNHKDAKVTQTYIDKRTLSQNTRRFH